MAKFHENHSRRSAVVPGVSHAGPFSRIALSVSFHGSRQVSMICGSLLAAKSRNGWVVTVERVLLTIFVF